eukprot:CAMPEP_0194518088 /NCGR_PEP_ID=MMETSP0253-20130528/51413_1 /TAXON_ID=2966 /ORGANISM="Noctiluca scintillans" /LENGTH=166 /DNA_ID=CAMNT_0039362109 /DNA_START=529 /DNA_END=1029 /DNA_ORIENTATION=-
MHIRPPWLTRLHSVSTKENLGSMHLHTNVEGAADVEDVGAQCVGRDTSLTQVIDVQADLRPSHLLVWNTPDLHRVTVQLARTQHRTGRARRGTIFDWAGSRNETARVTAGVTASVTAIITATCVTYASVERSHVTGRMATGPETALSAVRGLTLWTETARPLGSPT